MPAQCTIVPIQSEPNGRTLNHRPVLRHGSDPTEPRRRRCSLKTAGRGLDKLGRMAGAAAGLWTGSAVQPRRRHHSMLLAALVLAMPVADAWRHCEFPKTKWFAYDELLGRSTGYSIAAMNGKAYSAGYMDGSFGLFGNTKDGVVPPSQAHFGDAQSKLEVCHY